jgi:transcriptional regulator with GAF, ATPase, and Fis domain
MEQISVKSGASRGASWTLDDDQINIGRGAGCELILKDPSVSREHCRIQRSGEVLELVHLSRKSPTLLNGLPISDKVIIRPGDEITVGVITLILLNSGEAGDPKSEEPTTETLSLPRSDVIYLRNKIAANEATENVTTNTFKLFASFRRLTNATSVEELFDRLRSELDSFFNSATFWVVRVNGSVDNSVVRVQSSGEIGDSDTPESTVREIYESGESQLTTDSKEVYGGLKPRSIIAAPIVAGTAKLGVIVVQTDHSHMRFTKVELEVLTAIACSLGPILFAQEELRKLQIDLESLRTRSSIDHGFIGESEPIQALREQVIRVGPTALNVLIVGETGTGKELVANWIHTESERRHGPFVVVNCAAVPSGLFESEFFGHRKGAFTGADRAKNGYLDRAHGGTLFLDEIGELPIECQASLLRSIELGTYSPLGATREKHADIRVLAATNRNLESQVDSGTFRLDLYHRVGEYELYIPPLRNRKDDIAILAEYFLEQMRGQSSTEIDGYTKEAINRLQHHDWPGNVRELRNAIARTVSLSQGPQIGPDDLEFSMQVTNLPQGAMKTLKEVEDRHIDAVLMSCNGNVREAARILGIGRATLYNKLKSKSSQLKQD